jgi:hypothetical protein
MVVVQFETRFSVYWRRKVEAEPLPMSEIDLSNGNGSVKTTFTANLPSRQIASP